MNEENRVVAWQRIEPTIVTKIDYRNVIIKTFKLPDDAIVTRATFAAENKRSAGVIAVTEDNKVIIARMFRPGPEKIMREIPGGYVDEGEDPKVAATRELLEETGYAPKEMTFLGEFGRDAYVNGTWYYYLATGCTLVSGQALDHDEFISIELCDIDTFIENAKQGQMTDPYAVLAAYDQLKKLQEKEI